MTPHYLWPGALLLLPLLCASRQTYYVIPEDGLCPEVEGECHALGYYLANSSAYFASNTTMVFLSGHHHLNMTLRVREVESLVLVGNDSTVTGSLGLQVPSSQIHCKGDSTQEGILFEFASNLTIQSLLFSECGDSSDQFTPLAALTFNHSFDLNLRSIVVQNSSGYGIFGANTLGKCTIENSAFIFTVGTGQGGNAYFHYENCQLVDGHSSLHISSSYFLHGDNLYCSSCRSATCRAMGLTLIIGSECSDLEISVVNSTADSNRGCYGGNLAILFQALHPNNHTVSISGSRFHNGVAYYGGGGVSVESLLQFSNLMPQLVLVGDCEFVNNTDTALFLGTLCSLSFRSSNFFKHNSGVYGGAVLFSPGSSMLLHTGTSLYFTENHAAIAGGAIWAPSQHINMGISFCFYRPVFTHTSYGVGVHLEFQGNTAVFAGNAVYGGSVEHCRIVSTSRHWEQVQGLEVFEKIFDVSNDEQHTSEISSDPCRVCFCSSGLPDCSMRERTISAFPGESLQVSAITIGQMNGTVPGSIYASVQDSHAQLGNLQATQRVSSYLYCENLTYTIFSNANYSGLHLGTLDSNTTVGVPNNDFPTVMLHINLKSCPPGFCLSQASSRYHCDCDPVLRRHGITCNITTQEVQRSRQVWIAYYNSTNGKSSGLLYSPNCPFDYCNKNVTVLDLRDSASIQCANHRSGVLCGECESGYSLALGTTQCLKCSNSYLTLLLPMIFAGFVLVTFLFFFDWTVTEGTVNGIVLYANVVWVNRTIFYPSEAFGVFNFFTAWLNLDLGIQMCFYNGMDTYAKVWLQFAFPIYIWLIVAVIIAVSHRYSRVAQLFGNNPVKVLATLFLLSYAKLQRTIIAALSVTTLTYPDGQVKWLWKYDPNIEYFSWKHVPLFAVAIVVVLVLVLPYVLLLLFIQVLRRAGGSNQRRSLWLARLLPLFDAYTAPYKPACQFWVGFLLLIRAVLLIVFAANRTNDSSVNLVAISAVVILVLTLAWNLGGVFKSRALDVLESSFLLNLGIFSVATHYIATQGGNQAALAYCSAGVVFAEFVGIMLYHFFAKSNHLGKRCIRKLRRNCKPHQVDVLLVTDPPPDDNSQFREPLLEYLADTDEDS